MTLALPKSLGIDVANPQPGIYPGIAAAIYHSIALPSASKLKTLYAKSAAHMRWELEHPTASKAIFTAIHTCTFEPEIFPTVFTITERCGGITGKGERCTRGGVVRIGGMWFCAQHAGTGQPDDVGTVLSAGDYVDATNAAGVVLSHPVAGPLIKAVPQEDRELTIIFEDRNSGVLVKARLDSVIRRAGIINDLKTAGDADRGFWIQAKKNLYLLQAEMYVRACRQSGIEIDQFQFIGVEEKPPHGVKIHQVDMDALDRKWSPVVDGLLDRVRRHQEAGEWPSYAPEVAGRMLDIEPYKDDDDEF